MKFGERRDRLIVEAGIAIVSVPFYYFARFLGGLQLMSGGGIPGASLLTALAIFTGFAAGFAFIGELIAEKMQNRY